MNEAHRSDRHDPPPGAPEALFRVAVELSPSGLLMTDARGRILLANHQVEAMLGYAEAELLGQPVEMLLPASMRGLHEAHHTRFLQRPTARRMGAGRELVGRHKDGHEVPIEIGLAPVRHEGQIFVLASIIDITERRRTRRSINEAAARWQTLMQSAMDGVALLSPDGVIVEANHRMANILGRSLDAIVGERLSNFAPAPVGEGMPRFDDAIAKGTGHVYGVELTRADGTRVVVDFALDRVESGGQHAVLAVGRDVTEQRDLERQFRQAQKMEAVGRLAGGIAHDFNNLLTAILGYAQLLGTALPEGSPGHDDLSEIQRAAGRAASLTRQLLAFSRQQVLEPEVLSVNAVVGDLERMLRRLIGEDVTVVTQLAADAGNVRADRGQLEQVLLNIAINARDAMPEGGMFTIETAAVELTEAYAAAHRPSVPGHYVVMAFSDTGAGMTEEVRSRVFEPFFTTKERDKGTGLGLSTVYGIVKQSGGFIWVYSEPGAGSTFKVYLPRVAVAESAPLRAPAVGDLRGTETILLVEDDDLLRPLARQILRRYGYTVLDAASAADAWSVAAEHEGEIDLLLTDLVMPGEGGRSLAERLHAARPSLRALYMSGYTDEAIVSRGVLDRGLAFLQKPFSPDALARKVREVLEARAAS